MKQHRALVLGAGGFIGSHLVKDLRQRGYHVIGADIKLPEFDATAAHEFRLTDLRDPANTDSVLRANIDSVYQLAADMGGAGFISTGDNDADLFTNSALINLNVARSMLKHGVNEVFFSSSACVYSEHLQLRTDVPALREQDVYPACPDSEYGWEKLMAERMWLSMARNHGFRVRIARLHNVFGPFGTWNTGREKAPAALCRKVLQSQGAVEIWGPGTQTRSFLYIDQCIEGIHRIMTSDYDQTLNLGSDRMISINDLAMVIAGLAQREISVRNVPGPQGVMGRSSDNTLIQSVLGWSPADDLERGLSQTLDWIATQMSNSTGDQHE
jgi:GDP-D-mannose 3',5'-epimerase